MKKKITASKEKKKIQFYLIFLLERKKKREGRAREK
jgi:hypothetical protein